MRGWEELEGEGVGRRSWRVRRWEELEGEGVGGAGGCGGGREELEGEGVGGAGGGGGGRSWRGRGWEELEGEGEGGARGYLSKEDHVFHVTYHWCPHPSSLPYTRHTLQPRGARSDTELI